MTTTNTYGRQVVVPLTNKSGGAVAAGDVVIIDTSNNDAFTTTTSAGFTGGIGIAQETIASNAIGRVLVSGYAALVNVNASVTRGHYGATHTVAKQAADSASRGAGTFCLFLTGGTTPDAIVYPSDLAAAALTDPMTTRGDIIVRNSANTTARLAVGSAGKIFSSDGTDATWGNGPMTTAGDIIIGGASGLPTRLAAGATSGHVLTSNGAGAAPSWQAGGGGGGLAQSFLGYNTVGASFETVGANSKVYAKTFTTAGTVLVLSVDCHLQGASAANIGGPVGAIYDNVAGVPGTPIATCPGSGPIAVPATTPRWYSSPLGVYLPAGTYWMVVRLADVGGGILPQIAYDTGTDHTGAGAFETFPVWASDSTTARKYSIRLNVLS